MERRPIAATMDNTISLAAYTSETFPHAAILSRAHATFSPRPMNDVFWWAASHFDKSPHCTVSLGASSWFLISIHDDYYFFTSFQYLKTCMEPL